VCCLKWFLYSRWRVHDLKRVNCFIILYANFLVNPLIHWSGAVWYFSIIWLNSAFLSNGWYCTHSYDNTTCWDRSLSNTRKLNSDFLSNWWYCMHGNDKPPAKAEVCWTTENTTCSDQVLPISILPFNVFIAVIIYCSVEMLKYTCIYW
jgi:hypothetical protein